MSIHFQNPYLKIVIELEPFFTVTEFVDRRNGRNLLRSETGLLTADRNRYDAAEFLGQSGNDREYQLRWRFGDIVLTRHLYFYDRAPAVRWYDVYESAADCAGMYYSTLVRLQLPEVNPAARIVDWFSCSDQSNRRELETVAVAGKNRGAYFLTDELFLYKEGPMPDCQPIKGEYDFLYEPAAGRVEMLGLGFDNLHRGETRRANGVVIGLRRDYGLQRYNLERYAGYPAERESASVLANSWPDLELGISEAVIAAELHAAAESGVNVVFIDDGWFDLYMGPIDEKKFPNRFAELARIARGYGIEIGLWCNPLCLDIRDPRMELWSGFDHRDLVAEPAEFNWLARTGDYVYSYLSSNTEYALADLMVKEFFNYMKNHIAGMFANYGIRHFKFDCYQLNAQDTRLGDAHLHYEKYRDLCAALEQEIPGLVISFDVTRGNRPNFNFALDYGRLFLENRGRYIPDHRYYHPWMALANTWYTMKYVPARQLETEMMPQAAEYDLEYILGTTVFSTPLYWGCLVNTPPERRRAMKTFYARLAPLRRKLAEYLCVPLGEMPARDNWSAVAALAPDGSEGFIAVYRHDAASESFSVPLPFGTRTERIFGRGTAEIRDGRLLADEKQPFSCSFYRFS